MTFFYYLLLTLFLFLCPLLCAVVLVQESKTTGLGASFGGDAGESLFGTSTPEVLKKITAYLGVAFLIGCLILSVWTQALGHIGAKEANKTEMIER